MRHLPPPAISQHAICFTDSMELFLCTRILCNVWMASFAELGNRAFVSVKLNKCFPNYLVKTSLVCEWICIIPAWLENWTNLYLIPSSILRRREGVIVGSQAIRRRAGVLHACSLGSNLKIAGNRPVRPPANILQQGREIERDTRRHAKPRELKRQRGTWLSRGT